MTSQFPSLRNITLSELTQSLCKGNLTSSALVQAYLSRIAEVNNTFHAVIETNPSALEDALDSDRDRESQLSCSALYGVPILLKDNIPTLDATETTCGSFALLGARPSREADVVTALRRAGALILGKANMAEWSGFRSTSGCSGWSARGGQCTGVYYPGTKASGSSSGCAVAVALGLCLAAIGTETCWSIVSPAEKSGVVGYKPTRGVISSEGIIAASERLDTVGVLTRNVADAMLFVGEIVKYSTHYASTTRLQSLRELDPEILTTDLTGLRIGVPWDLDGFQTLGKTKLGEFMHVLESLKRAGADIFDEFSVPGAELYEIFPAHEQSIIIDTEMKASMEVYFSSLATNLNGIRNIHDLVEFTKNHPDEEYPARNVAVLERAAKTNSKDVSYLSARNADTFLTGLAGIHAALKRHDCAAMIIPFLSGTMQTLAAKAGTPVMSLPIGRYQADTPIEKDERSGLINVASGIPFSVYVYGGLASDSDVLRVGNEIERSMAVKDKLVPYLVPKTELVDVL